MTEAAPKQLARRYWPVEEDGPRRAWRGDVSYPGGTEAISTCGILLVMTYMYLNSLILTQRPCI